MQQERKILKTNLNAGDTMKGNMYTDESKQHFEEYNNCPDSSYNYCQAIDGGNDRLQCRERSCTFHDTEQFHMKNAEVVVADERERQNESWNGEESGEDSNSDEFSTVNFWKESLPFIDAGERKYVIENGNDKYFQKNLWHENDRGSKEREKIWRQGQDRNEGKDDSFLEASHDSGIQNENPLVNSSTENGSDSDKEEGVEGTNGGTLDSCPEKHRIQSPPENCSSVNGNKESNTLSGEDVKDEEQVKNDGCRGDGSLENHHGDDNKEKNVSEILTSEDASDVMNESSDRNCTIKHGKVENDTPSENRHTCGGNNEESTTESLAIENICDHTNAVEENDPENARSIQTEHERHQELHQDLDHDKETPVASYSTENRRSDETSDSKVSMDEGSIFLERHGEKALADKGNNCDADGDNASMDESCNSTAREENNASTYKKSNDQAHNADAASSEEGRNSIAKDATATSTDESNDQAHSADNAPQEEGLRCIAKDAAIASTDKSSHQEYNANNASNEEGRNCIPKDADIASTDKSSHQEYNANNASKEEGRNCFAKNTDIASTDTESNSNVDGDSPSTNDGHSSIIIQDADKAPTDERSNEQAHDADNAALDEASDDQTYKRYNEECKDHPNHHGGERKRESSSEHSSLENQNLKESMNKMFEQQERNDEDGDQQGGIHEDKNGGENSPTKGHTKENEEVNTNDRMHSNKNKGGSDENENGTKDIKERTIQFCRETDTTGPFDNIHNVESELSGQVDKDDGTEPQKEINFNGTSQENTSLVDGMRPLEEAGLNSIGTSKGLDCSNDEHDGNASIEFESDPEVADDENTEGETINSLDLVPDESSQKGCLIFNSNQEPSPPRSNRQLKNVFHGKGEIRVRENENSWVNKGSHEIKIVGIDDSTFMRICSEADKRVVDDIKITSDISISSPRSSSVNCSWLADRSRGAGGKEFVKIQIKFKSSNKMNSFKQAFELASKDAFQKGF